jgi:hypothetical protein
VSVRVCVGERMKLKKNIKKKKIKNRNIDRKIYR